MSEDRAMPGFWAGKIYLWLLFSGLAAAAVAGVAWGGRQGLFALLGLGILAAGFRLSELLIGVMTRVRTANGMAIGLLMLFKVSWWGGIFLLSRVVGTGDLRGLAAGFGAFLLALVAQGLITLGFPRVSSPRRD